MTLRQRFMAKVNKPDGDGCWTWTGCLSTGGYGRFQMGRRSPGGFYAADQAHRVSYEIHVGPIPDGMQLDHLCRNRRCVNPAHLEPVTNQENTRRGRDPMCRNGHPRTPQNTYVYPKTGHRQCKVCIQERYNRKTGASWEYAY